jgi:hypothetical protein
VTDDGRYVCQRWERQRSGGFIRSRTLHRGRTKSPSPTCKYRTAKLRERAYKPFNGGGMYLFVKPNGVKTYRLKYTMPSGKEGTLIIGNESMPSSQYF